MLDFETDPRTAECQRGCVRFKSYAIINTLSTIVYAAMIKNRLVLQNIITLLILFYFLIRMKLRLRWSLIGVYACFVIV
jgi:hypothetical protein